MRGRFLNQSFSLVSTQPAVAVDRIHTATPRQGIDVCAIVAASVNGVGTVDDMLQRSAPVCCASVPRTSFVRTTGPRPEPPVPRYSA